jgi:hypothetical protein
VDPGLEREAQVAALEALADAARAGGGRFIVIEGGAGIGKTRLLAEARAIAGSAGMRVLAARGGELEGEFAYGIVRELFDALLASPPRVYAGGGAEVRDAASRSGTGSKARLACGAGMSSSPDGPELHRLVDAEAARGRSDSAAGERRSRLTRRPSAAGPARRAPRR